MTRFRRFLIFSLCLLSLTAFAVVVPDAAKASQKSQAAQKASDRAAKRFHHVTGTSPTPDTWCTRISRQRPPRFHCRTVIQNSTLRGTYHIHVRGDFVNFIGERYRARS